MAEPTFEECWVDFLSRTDQNRVAAEFLKNHLEELHLQSAERVLGIGPGTGELDVDFMTALPEVKFYSAIEPDVELRGTLHKKIQNMNRNIQVDLRADTIETYEGPAEPVDLILMVHVCYYFKDSFRTQIKRALGWLKPGGQIILIHKESSNFRQEIENHMNSNQAEQTISIAWSIGEELKTMDISHREEKMQITLDWTLPGLASIVRIFTNLYPDKHQLEECVKIAKRHSLEGVTKVHENQLIHVVPQTALSSLA